MAIRVFVSHSTSPRSGCDEQERASILEHARFRRDFCDRLARIEGVEVIVDEQIPPGGRWREFLFEILGGCNAAVILANQQAVFHSPWVKTEAKILGCRAWNERKDFRLIVVPFGGLTAGVIEREPDWEPIALTELQMVPRSGLRHDDPGEVERTLEVIGESLWELGDAGRPSSTSGWIVARLGGLLDIGAAGLRDLAGRVGAEVAGVHEEGVLTRRVLRRLYELGPLGLKELLECPRIPVNRLDLDQILELLSTHWVDMSASSSLLPYSRASGLASRVPVLNGRNYHFTPQAYVRQICGLATPWPVIALHPKASRDDMIDQLRTELQARYERLLRDRHPGSSRLSPEALDAGLNKLLRDRLEKFEFPVFVAVPPPAATDRGLLDRIARTYPDLRLIVCSGTEPGRAAFSAPFRVIQPEIDLQVEEAEFDTYLAMKSALL